LSPPELDVFVSEDVIFVSPEELVSLAAPLSLPLSAPEDLRA